VSKDQVMLHKEQQVAEFSWTRSTTVSSANRKNLLA